MTALVALRKAGELLPLQKDLFNGSQRLHVNLECMYLYDVCCIGTEVVLNVCTFKCQY